MKMPGAPKATKEKEEEEEEERTNEIELMRTILGEHVAHSVILTCLNACAFDVSAALNWYFMEMAVEEEEAQSRTLDDSFSSEKPPIETSYTPFIQSGMSLTLHPFH